MEQRHLSVIAALESRFESKISEIENNSEISPAMSGAIRAQVMLLRSDDTAERKAMQHAFRSMAKEQTTITRGYETMLDLVEATEAHMRRVEVGLSEGSRTTCLPTTDALLNQGERRTHGPGRRRHSGTNTALTRCMILRALLMLYHLYHRD